MRLWYRKRGLDSAPDIPLVQVEYYFPEIDDPRLISAAIAHFRHKFDLVTNESVEELEQYCNGNSGVYHIVGKETIVAARDVIEKRLVFEAFEVTLGMNKEDAELEIGTGSQNDVYAWVSACPNEIRPEREGVVRAETLYGFNIMGHCENLPESRRSKHKTGCYLHSMSANNVGVGSWAFIMGLPFLTKAMKGWFENLHTFLRENKDMLE